MTVKNGRKLDAAHNKWLRRILYIALFEGQDYKQGDMGQEDMGNIIRRRTLCWMGHRMKGERQAVQAMDLSPDGERRRSRPRKNWQETIHEDIRCMNMTWSEAINLAEDREGWRNCVAQCAEMHGKY